MLQIVDFSEGGCLFGYGSARSVVMSDVSEELALVGLSLSLF
jgi:hypothetical protein